ncbi:MAG: peptidoglycan-binding protein [Oscillospiraceae bacterium]|nr:peptidoglycan-binding protein [Oscillospiraceae bacterium]
MQYYYGNDIDINFDAPQGNILPSYPGQMMQRGVMSEEVRTLQKMLRRVARNYPAIPLVEVNSGVFDGKTDAAVRAFQHIMGLTEDGIVGQGTWNRIVSIYNAVKRLNELDSEGISQADTETYYASRLRLGDRGYDVRFLQSYLDFVSLFYPDMARLDADGMFGPLTEQAVKTFQRLNGLTEDGIVGRQTINRLRNAYKEFYNSLSPASARLFYPDYAFSRGDSGEKVRLIQTMLNAVAQAAPELPVVAADGIYGSATTNAVLAFQRFAQLPISGNVGILTWNTLVSKYNEYYNPRYAEYAQAEEAEEEEH